MSQQLNVSKKMVPSVRYGRPSIPVQIPLSSLRQSSVMDTPPITPPQRPQLVGSKGPQRPVGSQQPSQEQDEQRRRDLMDQIMDRACNHKEQKKYHRAGSDVESSDDDSEPLETLSREQALTIAINRKRNNV